MDSRGRAEIFKKVCKPGTPPVTKGAYMTVYEKVAQKRKQGGTAEIFDLCPFY